MNTDSTFVTENLYTRICIHCAWHTIHTQFGCWHSMETMVRNGMAKAARKNGANSVCVWLSGSICVGCLSQECPAVRRVNSTEQKLLVLANNSQCRYIPFYAFIFYRYISVHRKANKSIHTKNGWVIGFALDGHIGKVIVFRHSR